MKAIIILCVLFYAEVYADCHGLCGRANEIERCFNCPPERNCKNRGILFKCLQKPDCPKSCVCKNGYIRNRNECVPDTICDSCKGPHEFFDCGSACDNECATLGQQNRTNCPIKNIVCNNKCYCKDGFARNDQKICVPISECEC